MKRRIERPWERHDGSETPPPAIVEPWRRIQIRLGRGVCETARSATTDWTTVTHWRFL